jgi:hypothetical protein
MRRPLAAAVLALTVVGTLNACGDSGDSDASGTSDSPATTEAEPSSETAPTSDADPTEPSEPSDSTVPSESSATNTAPASHDNSPLSRAKRSQVPMAKLPGFNADWTWDKASGKSGPRPKSPGQSRCMQASLTAIGGVLEYSTAYTVAGDTEDEAVLTTAVFPDEHTAQLAESVLASWQKKCRAHVSRQPDVDSVAVTEDRPLQTSVGPAHSRLVGYGPVEGDPDSGYFNGEGYVRDGDVISYLVMHNVGQDYNYDDDKEPVALGLLAAAKALKQTR